MGNTVNHRSNAVMLHVGREEAKSDGLEDGRRDRSVWMLNTREVQELVRQGLKPDMALLPFQMPRMEHGGIPLPPPVETRPHRVKSHVNIHRNMQLVNDEDNRLFVDVVVDCDMPVLLDVHFLLEEDKLWNCDPAISIHCPEGMLQSIRIPLSQGLSPEDLYSLSEGLFVMIIDAYVPLVENGPNESSRQLTFCKLHNQRSHWMIQVSSQEIILGKDTRYSIQEVFDHGHGGRGDCVVCMSSSSDTVVLPCRHLCLCQGCAGLLRVQSNRCPICRSHISRMLKLGFSEASISISLEKC